MKWAVLSSALLLAAALAPIVATNLGLVFLIIDNRSSTELSVEYEIGNGHARHAELKAGAWIARVFFVGADEGALEISANHNDRNVSGGYFSTHNGGLEIVTFRRPDSVEFREYFCAGC